MMKRLRKLIGYFFDLERLDNIRYALTFYFSIKEKYKRPLAIKGQLIELKKTDKRILIPLIETNHYQMIQILTVAKALQIRGAQIKVLVCDGALLGCEIKNVNNEHLKNPCFKCKFNIKYIVQLFGLEVIHFNDYLTDEVIKKLNLR